MARTLQPLGDRIVVKAVEQEGQTKSGLYVPDTAKERPKRDQLSQSAPAG